MERRTFLKLGGLSFPAVVSGCALDAEQGVETGTGTTTGALRDVDFALKVYRKEDMLALTFGFVNFVRTRDDGLRRINVDESAFIVVSHERQHVIEQAYEDSATGDPPPAKGPIASMLSGHSRVVYKVPDDVDAIQATIEDLLTAARDYELSVGVTATPPPSPLRGLQLTDVGFATGPLVNDDFQVSSPMTRYTPTRLRATRGIRTFGLSTGVDVNAGRVEVRPPLEIEPAEPIRPNSLQTSLELPFRLEMSPNRYGQWAHALEPVTSSNGRVELWHSRLGVRGADGTAIETGSYLNTVRALWSRHDEMDQDPNPDPELTPPVDPFPASLSPLHRVRIVHQSSNFALRDSENNLITPAPVDVNRLMLSALGGFLDLHGDWGDNPKYSLMLWEHRATLGRDHFVKIVDSGYLYPFGHRAVRVTITERKFKPDFPHEAYLWTRKFIVVKEPVLQYTSGRNLDGVKGTLRRMPFTMVNIKTLVTPKLEDPQNEDPVYKVEVASDAVGGTKPFRFECEALDAEGRLIQFTAPVVWVQGNLNDPVLNDRFGVAEDKYEEYGSAAESDFDGQRIAFAPSNEPDDTSYETYKLRFNANHLDEDEAAASGYSSRMVPFVDEVELAVEALRQVAGKTGTRRFSYHSKYKNKGFDTGNEGQIVFELADGQSEIEVSYDKSSDKSGGFVAPSFKLSGLSRKTGPVAGNLDDFASNTFKASDFFSGMTAKLFGLIDLSDIVENGGVDNAPKYTTQALDVIEGFIVDAQSLADDLNGVAGGTAAFNALNATLADIDPDKADLLTGDFATLDTALFEVVNSSPASGVGQGFWLDVQQRASSLRNVIGEIDDLEDIGKYLAGETLALDQRVKFQWSPPLKSFSLGGATVFEPGTMLLSGEVRAKASPGKDAGADMVCVLEDFTIYLFGKIEPQVTIPVDLLRFQTRAGKTSDVEVLLGEIGFGGVLGFVKTLSDIIPFGGFSDGPTIAVDETGISASFGFSIPSLAIGVFSLQNISLGAGFTIPFLGDPLGMSFNFCTRENPFLLTVLMIGGGGFFGLTINPNGIELLEAQFEAGAEIALDFGVASGSVSMMVGVYFKMEGDECTITGFITIHGEVDVLGGLISAALTLSLELTYSSGKLIGSAKMEIEVSVLFFSGTVTVEYEQKLAGSNGDPTFAQMMAPDPDQFFSPWDEYVNAFAA